MQSNNHKIRLKVEKLINLHQTANHENQKLKKHNNELTVKIEELQNKVIKLEDQNKIIRLGKAINGSGDDQNSRNLKLKLNEYIREIDKCLTLLHK